MMHKKQRTIGPGQEMISDFSETSIWEWDVFLSFRGTDTRYKFTDHLYHNLIEKNIRVFRDAEGLHTGDEISRNLVKAIEGSRLSVVIFSKDYASSNSCLDELVTILRCKEERKQKVIPIFYEVDPSKVRYQEMAVHEQKYGKDRVQNWTSAMEKASKLKGESYLAGYEYEFLEKIVNQIMSFLGPPRLYVVENPVGLGSRISDFLLLSESICPDQNDVQMLGIYGISGIGKTTFAKAFYNLVAVQFESASFVEVGGKASSEDGLVRLQETILATVLGEVDIKLRNIHEGVMEMQLRLRNKKILLILDDVDELVQLKKLAGSCNWFGPGSRVIITTRHQDLLRQHKVNDERTYELKPLDHDKALELFCWHAFKRSEPLADYANISNDLTDYAQGLPLALEIIGADVCGKEKDEWESTLADHKSNMSDDIFTRLKVSYDKLRYNAKQMFLDMACFFNGESWDYLEKIFDGCNFNPKVGMRVLKEKCFIRRQDGKVWMHNLVRDMGREIVRQESEAEPSKRSRLWHYEDVLRVLTTIDSGTSATQGLMLELPEHGVLDWNNNCFEKMTNLRILIIRNARFSMPPAQLPSSLIVLDWEEYPCSSFPPDFVGKRLLDLRLGNAIYPIQLGYPLKNVMRERMLETRSRIRRGNWRSYLLEKPVSEMEQVSLTKVEHGLTGILEKFVQGMESIMQMEMQHEFRDIIEKPLLELMNPIKMKRVLGDVKIYSVLQIGSMSRNIMELGVWNVLQNLVLHIEPGSQMEMEHGHRYTIEYMKPEIELFKQMTQALHGELSDIKRGLEWALGRGLLKVIVESDSEDTIRCLVDGVGSDHPCSSLVKECRQLLRKAEEVCLRHVPRKPNQVLKYFTQLPDRRGELGKILRDFCGAV